MSSEREENGEQLCRGLPPFHLLYRIFWSDLSGHSRWSEQHPTSGWFVWLGIGFLLSSTHVFSFQPHCALLSPTLKGRYSVTCLADLMQTLSVKCSEQGQVHRSCWEKAHSRNTMVGSGEQFLYLGHHTELWSEGKSLKPFPHGCSFLLTWSYAPGE